MLWRITSMLTLGCLAAVCIVSGYFIYSYVYRTLEDAAVVKLLSVAPNTEVINEVLYNKTQTVLALKNSVATSTLPSPLRNIFSYGSATSTNASAPSTSVKINR